MAFVANLMLFAAKNFTNRSRTGEFTAMIRVAPFFDSHCIFGQGGKGLPLDFNDFVC